MVNTELVARRIIMKLKGWDTEQEYEDKEDNPKEHTNELRWLIRELEKVENAWRTA